MTLSVKVSESQSELWEGKQRPPVDATSHYSYIITRETAVHLTIMLQ